MQKVWKFLAITLVGIVIVTLLIRGGLSRYHHFMDRFYSGEPVEPQAERAIFDLSSLQREQIQELNVYPRSLELVVAFPAHDPVVQEFAAALYDLTSYRPDHDTINTPDHAWRLEILLTDDTVIQLPCYIPSYTLDRSSRGDMVVIELPVEGMKPQAYLQSRALFHWYTTHQAQWPYAQLRYEHTLTTIRTRPPETLQALRVLDMRGGTPGEVIAAFQASTSSIREFVLAFADVQPYETGTASPTLSTGFFALQYPNDQIVIRFSQRQDRLVGIIGEWSRNIPETYGTFQSEHLRAWYATYVTQ